MKTKQVVCGLIAVLLMLIFTACGDGNGGTHTQTLKIGDYVQGKGTLVWLDDFSGNSLDTTKWNIDTGTGVQYDSDLRAWGNNEKQWYHRDNVSVADGKLIIEAKKQSPAIGGMNYTSARITTAGVKDATTDVVTPQKYITPKTGYVEAMLKSPKGAGFWPCFFMLGANYLEYSGFEKKFWPYCGEIDIFEANGAKLTSPDHAVHYGTSYPNKYWYQYKEIDVEDISANWHTYGVGWDSTGIRFYINGTETFSVPLPFSQEASGANSAAFYDGPGFTVTFCLAVGGEFLNNTVPADSVFTSNDREARSLMVDWVRVYE